MYCLDASILQKKTIPETPQQKGLAERRNTTLLEIARCFLIDSGLPNMKWGSAILHATRIRNLVVKRGEEKCPSELLRDIKPKLSISKLSIFGGTVFMSKRDKDVGKLEPKALEGKFVGYTEGDNGYLVYVPKARKVAAVRDVIIMESEGGVTATGVVNTQMMVIKNDVKKEEQGTSIAKKEEWNDAESLNTQKTTLRRDASDVEEAALDEEFTATRASLRNNEKTV